MKESITRLDGRVWIETFSSPCFSAAFLRITRLDGRVWIETEFCGIVRQAIAGITRLDGRVWIETVFEMLPPWLIGHASPDWMVGCGLKQAIENAIELLVRASPDLMVGRRLKPDPRLGAPTSRAYPPDLMAGHVLDDSRGKTGRDAGQCILAGR